MPTAVPIMRRQRPMRHVRPTSRIGRGGATRGRASVGRRGVALLEAMLALAILATAATALVSLTAASAAAVRQAREGEAELRAAHAFFEAVALWSRADLDRHLGGRAQHPWRLAVSRPARALYVVVLTDSTGRRELLRTALHRPEPARDAARGLVSGDPRMEEVFRAP